MLNILTKVNISNFLSFYVLYLRNFSFESLFSSDYLLRIIIRHRDRLVRWSDLYLIFAILGYYTSMDVFSLSYLSITNALINLGISEFSFRVSKLSDYFSSPSNIFHNSSQEPTFILYILWKKIFLIIFS